ncbi:hypothetical protein MNBD_GAMMA03-735 [hydrothermal vent metagenome]|uniref:Protein kinase domain-containing protein n=1 Tax=hydrothermal vent metagenome TaxID=652676 RepID=A0A3B0WUL8_9ZZZZ
MNPEVYKFIKKTLIHAQDLSVDERHDYVRKVCQDQPELIQSIMDMLAIEDSPDDNIMEQAPIIQYFPEADVQESRELKAGEKINQYTIIKKIGSGGMGIVYVAKQNYPAERQVALKLITQIPI